MNVRSMTDDNRDLRLSDEIGTADYSVSSNQRNSSPLDAVRAEARQIVAAAQQEVAELRAKTAAYLERERNSLDERALALEAARKQLDADVDAVEKRCQELEQAAFEEARKAGFERGVQQGRDEGLRLGKEEALAALEERTTAEVARRTSEMCDSAMAPLRKLVQEMKGTRQALLKNWEENILQISAAIAYQAIMREPTLLHDAPLDLLREALELAMNCATLKIRMNPNDVANLNEAIKGVLEETGNLAKSEVVSDPKITPGGCLVETSLGVVDERLESRLERIVAELSE